MCTIDSDDIIWVMQTILVIVLLIKAVRAWWKNT